MKTIEYVRIAFRKLKAEVYFNKTVLHLRDKVVAYEASEKFDYNLDNIAEAYDKMMLGEESPLMSEILASINIMYYPKKMKSFELNDNTVISVGNPKEEPVISELQYFIDMDVNGHILGILWIMKFGKRLEEVCFDNARGNRLRNNLIWNEEGEILESPALFEPYFAQYSLWRDKGLSCAESLLAQKQDALIVTLDLKKFYYRTGINESVFNTILEPDEKDTDITLHKTIFMILRRYTEILDLESVDHSGIALPIGFLPSAVLSNWCLEKFDKGILDFWNPAYYGRYVDDVIIIEKIEKGSEIYKKARENVLTKDDVIDYYLGEGRRRNTAYFALKTNENSSSFVESKNRICVTNEKIDNDSLYKVNEEFCLSDKSLYEFQIIKTRIIALFAENNSTALLNKFKKEIYTNVSEFRLMPEVGEAFSQDDFSEFYRIENDATINKLRGVREILMDKYELSKFLGRYRVVSSMVDDGSTKRFTRIIGKMFNNRELIENYILWERVFEIFLTDKDYSGFIKFAKKIKTAISKLEVTDNNINIESVKDSLVEHLISTLNRVLSLIWGGDANKIIKAVCDEEVTLYLREEYLSKRMSNKYVAAIPVEILAIFRDNTDVNFTDFTDSFRYICNKGELGISDYTFLPYFRQAQDIAITMFFQSICSNNGNENEITNRHEEYLAEIRRWGEDTPVKLRELQNSNASFDTNKGLLIKIGNQKEKKLKIAIANVNVSGVTNLENSLQGKKPNRKYLRYRALAELLNMAIKEKANMLVLPENYVPLEWLSALATKAARENIAIITGVEHIIVGKKVYNYTAVILPFRYFNAIPTSAMFFQLKKHYSPGESRIIDGYGYSPICGTEKRPIYQWYDCYFPVYCCFELAAIYDRAEFISWADMIIAVEFNKDTNYFGSIVESLTRDLHCYCVQVNTSEYGDSRITQPTKREMQNLLTVKGGLNQALLVGEVDIQSLREFQIKKYELQKNGFYKPTPPGMDVNIVLNKIAQSFNSDIVI